MDETLLAALITAIAGLIAILLREWFILKRFKEGLKSTTEALELRKRELADKELQDQRDLEQRRIEQEAREKWKGLEFGINLLDLIFSNDNDEN